MAELNIAQPMRFRVDVKTGLVEQPQRESLMKGDKKANRIIAEIVNGGVPQDITGVTVKGKFCRPPDLDEIELSGTAEGNLAIVQLTDACYAQSGNYQATVSLVFDDVERTVLFISGTVLRSGSGNAAGEDAGGGSSTGSGLPSGGTAGQVLVKMTDASGDAGWKTLTATDVKARPDTWMPTAADVGALPSDGTAANANQLNGKKADEYALRTDLPKKAEDVGALAKDAQAADSAMLGGKAPEYYIQPRNLLDNSDFRNPVNQRSASSYMGVWVYGIDRWVYSGTSVPLTVENGYINLPIGSKLIQAIPIKKAKAVGKYFTFTINCAGWKEKILTSGGIADVDGVHFSGGLDNANLRVYSVEDSEWVWAEIENSTTAVMSIEWAALYEGEYTADNLPPYVPKGYAAELAECRRYYREDPIAEVNHSGIPGMVLLDTPFYEPPMRLTPSYSIKDYAAGQGDLADASAISNSWGGDKRRINLSYFSTGQASQCSFTLVSSAEL